MVPLFFVVNDFPNQIGCNVLATPSFRLWSVNPTRVRGIRSQMAQDLIGCVTEPGFDVIQCFFSLQQVGLVGEVSLKGDLFVAAVEVGGLEQLQHGCAGNGPEDVGHGGSVNPGDRRGGTGEFDLTAHGE